MRKPVRQPADEQSWHAEALRLFDVGYSVAQVAERVGRDLSLVHGLLRPETEMESVAPRPPRPIRKVIDQSAIPDAARAFAAGEIGRDELMRRISP
ncbi:MAG TPA: hypothetical protein VEF90_17690 [Xanthobacteraceae bacterium]|nr:hypothetical protein [Xanthobacteraceae bacterium]